LFDFYDSSNFLGEPDLSKVSDKPLIEVQAPSEDLSLPTGQDSNVSFKPTGSISDNEYPNEKPKIKEETVLI